MDIACESMRNGVYMRIDAMNQVSQLYRTDKTKKYNQLGTASLSDKVEISQIGKDMQIGKNAVAGAPEIREDRVAQLKAALENGSYHVDDDDLAEKLLESFDLPF